VEDVTRRFLAFCDYLLAEGIVNNDSQIAVSISKSPSFMTELRKGRSKVGLDTIQNTVKTYHDVISAEWLLLEEGEMLDKKRSAAISRVKKNTKSLEPITGEMISVQSHNRNVVQIPVTDVSVAAGSGRLNADFIETADLIALPQNMVDKGFHLCVRNRGESMAPTIQDSSYVVVRLLDRSEWYNIRNEHVYVVTNTEGKSYLKRVKNRFQRGFITLMSDNPDKASYPNFNLQEEEIHNIWYAEWIISAKMPNIHAQYYDRLQDLEDKYEDVINMLQQIVPEKKK